MRTRWVLALTITAVVMGAVACGDSPSVTVQSHSAQAVTTTAPQFPPLSPTSTSTTTVAGAPTLQAVTYHGVRLQVPGSWPVYDLASDTTRCVRSDQHAVFLGTQGAKPDCPARLIGRTETVHIQPLGAGTRSSEALATQTTTVNELNAHLDPASDVAGAMTVVLPDQSLLVTITFATDPTVANQILQSLHAA